MQLSIINYKRSTKSKAVMESFLGKWKTESGQGFDDFLKDRGVGQFPLDFLVFKLFYFISGLALRTAVKTTTTVSTFGK